MVTKRGDLPLDHYMPFLVNRWLSFINPTVCSNINQINSQTLLEDKEMHYKVMLSLFPKIDYCPKINYIKKVKEDENIDPLQKDNRIAVLATKYEISEKEVISLIAFKESLDLQ